MDEDDEQYAEVRCPVCGAREGRPCYIGFGDVGANLVHQERIYAAESVRGRSDLFEGDPDETIDDLADLEFPQTYSEEMGRQLANEAVVHLLALVESAEFDDRTQELVLSATTPSGIEVVERLASVEELGKFFEAFGFSNVSEGTGNECLRFGYNGDLPLNKREIRAVLADSGAKDLFPPLNSDETTLYRSANILVPATRIELSSVNEELIRYLASHPKTLYNLEPRRFEELVAAIFRDFGYEVILTPRTRDGGFDIRAVRKDSVGTLLYLVECKRYADTNPVGVEIVRGLHGVAAVERATCAVIATTSHFTKDAKEFADKVKYQMSLRDYNDLVAWLRRYPTSTNRQR
jgi:Restriction endonuclease